jgi:drug/metabolite transporter (DMT)-like permease
MAVRGATPSPRATSSPRSGYALVGLAAALWGVNGSLVRLALDDGMPATRIAELRALTAAGVLFAALAIWRPRLLRVERRDLGLLAAYGVCGIAAAEVTSFLAIQRLDVAVALIVQFTAPVLLLVWLRLVHGRRFPARLWLIAGSVVGGCALLMQVHRPGAVSPLGLAAACASAVALCAFLVLGERAGRRHAPATCVAWGSLFAFLAWAIPQPPWSFPFAAAEASLAPLALSCTLGMLLPLCLMIVGLQRIPAARAAMVGTLEPVVGALVALLVFGQALGPLQLLGGAIVVAAVVALQRSPQTAGERTP